MSIFVNDIQIAEITKSCYIENNLDKYVIFLLDEYVEYKDIVIFFNLYFENCFFGNQREIVNQSKVIRKFYTNYKNERYNSNWLPSNFAGANLDRVMAEKDKKHNLNKPVSKELVFL